MTSTPEPFRRRWFVASLALALAGAAQAAPGEADVAAARSALARGDGIAAEAALNRVMAAGSQREAVAAAMGEAWILQGNLRRAREWLGGRFATGTELHGYRMLGTLERAEGNLPAAGAAYDAALRYARCDAPLWVDIGRLRYAGGEQRQAIDAADQALACDARDPRALEFRGQLVRDRFGPAAALAWFEAGLAATPDDPGLLGEYAATLSELDRAGEMLAVTRRVLERDPGNARAFYLQAVLAARAGNGALARSLVSRMRGGSRDGPAVLLLQGALDLEAGNPATAIDLLDRLARQQPFNLRAQRLLARAFYEAGNRGELLSRFAARASQADATPYLMLLVARAHEDDGRRDLAAPLLDRAARLGVPPLAPIAGGAALDSEAAERARAASPGSSDVQVLAGDAQLAQGRSSEALQRYRLAAEIRLPGDLLVRMLAALGAAGQPEEQAALAGGWFAGNPASPLGMRLIAAIAAGGGDWARASSLLEGARNHGGERDALLLADLALAQLRGGDATAALVTARRAYGLAPASATVSQIYGMALAAGGKQPRAARSLLTKARAIGGDNPLLAEVLAGLPR